MKYLFEKDGSQTAIDLDDHNSELLVKVMIEDGFRVVDSGPIVSAYLEYKLGVDLEIAALDNGISSKELKTYIRENDRDGR